MLLYAACSAAATSKLCCACWSEASKPLPGSSSLALLLHAPATHLQVPVYDIVGVGKGHKVQQALNQGGCLLLAEVAALDDLGVEAALPPGRDSRVVGSTSTAYRGWYASHVAAGAHQGWLHTRLLTLEYGCRQCCCCVGASIWRSRCYRGPTLSNSSPPVHSSITRW
jgi:hypothetical protein